MTAFDTDILIFPRMNFKTYDASVLKNVKLIYNIYVF